MQVSVQPLCSGRMPRADCSQLLAGPQSLAALPCAPAPGGPLPAALAAGPAGIPAGLSACLASVPHRARVPRAVQGPGPGGPPAAPGVRPGTERQPAVPGLPGKARATCPPCSCGGRAMPCRKADGLASRLCHVKTPEGLASPMLARLEPARHVSCQPPTRPARPPAPTPHPPTRTHTPTYPPCRRATTTSSPSRPRPPLPARSRLATQCPSTARCWRCGKPTVSPEGWGGEDLRNAFAEAAAAWEAGVGGLLQSSMLVGKTCRLLVGRPACMPESLPWCMPPFPTHATTLQASWRRQARRS